MFFGDISEWKSKSAQLVLFNDIAVIYVSNASTFCSVFYNFI